MDELTFGQNVLKRIIPTEEDLKVVDKIQVLYAQIIDLLNELPTENDPSERLRLVKVAITQAEGAAMWANKAVVWKAKEFISPPIEPPIEVLPPVEEPPVEVSPKEIPPVDISFLEDTSPIVEVNPQ